jgi:hypothetical protein
VIVIADFAIVITRFASRDQVPPNAGGAERSDAGKSP